MAEVTHGVFGNIDQITKTHPEFTGIKPNRARNLWAQLWNLPYVLVSSMACSTYTITGIFSIPLNLHWLPIK